MEVINELEQIDADISFAISCLYQNGMDSVAEEINANVQCLFKYIEKLGQENNALKMQLGAIVI